MEERESKIEVERNKTTDRGGGGGGVGKAVAMAICGTLVYYHCAFGNSSLLSLIADVLIVLLCSLAILGLLFRQLNISVPVDPLEWQISQDAANTMVAGLANTIGAAESVLRVAATGHDKRLFVKVVICLYILSALGRLVSGITVAYAGLCLLCLYMLAENSQSIGTCLSWFLSLRNAASVDADNM
ncbi:Reticulon family protein [Tripterygium wilfordii]|uniref:Reticulon family protein n=1 Tax=Tripterygium wilfordii TaxID=458696 RepID=A0A7J7BYR2_TRIWF|nr:reticulon-like protein B22 [Tripterygium wilfordii]KAF5726825.1 Reticulon family protein [Tripterygium wilfordii]